MQSIFDKIALCILAFSSSVFSLSDLEFSDSTHKIDRGDHEALEICRLDSFLPTKENYQLANVTDWIHNYTLSIQDTPYYKEHGLPAMVAYEFLGDSGFVCDMYAAHHCTVTCTEVVQKVENINTARNVYFFLLSTSHLNTVAQIIHNGLLAAEINIGLTIDVVLQQTFYQHKATSAGETVKGAVFDITMALVEQGVNVLISQLVPGLTYGQIFVLISFLKIEQTKRIHEQFKKEYPNYDASAQDTNIPDDGKEMLKKMQEINMLMNDDLPKYKKWADKAWLETVEPKILKDKINGMLYSIGLVRMNTENKKATLKVEKVAFKTATVQATSAAREQLAVGCKAIFQEATSGPDGVSFLSMILDNGPLNPPNDDAMDAWSAANVEQLITKDIIFMIFNVEMMNQGLFLSCTTQFLRRKDNEQHLMDFKKAEAVDTCEEDNTGPQHYKACVDDGKQVCYLYGWDQSSHNHLLHHLEVPDGEDRLKADYNLTYPDVVRSSFESHRQRLQYAAPYLRSKDIVRGPREMTDPSNAGRFTLSVCEAPYNMNGHSEDYRHLGYADFSPFHSIHSFPCFCGPMSADTQTVWKGMNLRETPVSWYKSDVCQYMKDKKVPEGNKLERWFMDCGMKTHPSYFKFRVEGADPMCPTAVEEVISWGVENIEDLEREQKIALLCKVTQPGGACKKYQGTPISQAWDESWDVVKREWRKELPKAISKVRRNALALAKMVGSTLENKVLFECAAEGLSIGECEEAHE